MSKALRWQQLDWQRLLDPIRVADALRNRAADGRSPIIRRPWERSSERTAQRAAVADVDHDRR
ncbi:hypothetical protein GCM10023350_23230 [Nocardioides endophyticus]|uniref:Uncharacterized protein n=1 Tax=Nocardioides endophyticus TaxID=1353775 RepID=A0ABP8YSD1_9ACTN